MRSRTRFITLLTTALMAAACGGGADTATVETTEPAAATTTAPASTTTIAPTTTTSIPPTTTTREPEFDVAWDYADPETHPTVELLDAGAEPREVRVWQPSLGRAVDATMTFAFTIEQTIEDIQTVTTISVEADMVMEVVDVTDEGFALASTITDTTVTSPDPDVEFQTQRVYDDILGIPTYTLTAPDGVALATAGFDDVAGAETFSEGFNGTIVPLPSEPIGVGAQWTVAGTLNSGGIIFLQTTTATLTEIDGDRLLVDMHIEQTVDPDGTFVSQFDRFDVVSEGAATAIWDLSTGFPVSGASDIVQTLSAALTVDGVTETLDQVTMAAVRLTSTER